MDAQPTPPQFPSGPTGNERPTGYRPEDLQVSGPEQPSQPAQPEVANGPGGGGPAQAPPAGQPPARTLSRDDVMAAIAAAPGPNVPAVTAGPGSADDVDVIEPTWVSAAEQAIAQHRGDPYGEEEAIEDLNRDYLDKRYGYHVADPDQGGK